MKTPPPGIELATAEAFTVLSIFNAMQFSVGTLPWSLKMITEAKVRQDWSRSPQWIKVWIGPTVTPHVQVGFNRLQQLLELRDFIHPSNRADTSSNRSCDSSCSR